MYTFYSHCFRNLKLFNLLIVFKCSVKPCILCKIIFWQVVLWRPWVAKLPRHPNLEGWWSAHSGDCWSFWGRHRTLHLCSLQQSGSRQHLSWGVYRRSETKWFYNKKKKDLALCTNTYFCFCLHLEVYINGIEKTFHIISSFCNLPKRNKQHICIKVFCVMKFGLKSNFCTKIVKLFL